MLRPLIAAVLAVTAVVCQSVGFTALSAATHEAKATAFYRSERSRLPDKGLPIEARRVADWISRSGDNAGLPFMIVDKVNSQLFLFDAGDILRATTPVLLGLARGDDSPAGIGSRKLSAIRPAERITPAGRFVVETGVDLTGQDILWIDYDAAIALHRASDRQPGSGRKSRVDRLSSATAAEKRVSLGCINVSTQFYDNFIRPTFSRTAGIAYILPETRSSSVEFKIVESDSKSRVATGL